MFTKWLIKALKRRYSKMTAEEQDAVRKLGEDGPKPIDEPKVEIKQKSKTKSKRRVKTMTDEKEVEKKVETSKVDDKTENNEVEKEKSTDKVDKTEEKVDETKKEVETDKTEENPTADEEPTAPEVQTVEPVGNGIDINDLVTKEELMQRLSAFEAKFDAVVKENTDLKDQLSKSKEETNGLKEKYENKDFGNFNKQGLIEKNKDANETFDSYSKQFM